MYWFIITFLTIINILFVYRIISNKNKAIASQEKKYKYIIEQIYKNRFNLIPKQNIDEEETLEERYNLEQQMTEELKQNAAKSQYINKKNKIIYLILIFISCAPLLIYIKTNNASLASKETVTKNQISEQAQEVIKYIQETKEQLKNQPNSVEINQKMVDIYMNLRLYNKAITHIDKMIQQEPKQAQHLSLKALALYIQNNSELNQEINDYVNKAFKINENDFKANSMMAFHWDKEEELEKAITYWQKILNNNDENIETEEIKKHIDSAKNKMKKLEKNNFKMSFHVSIDSKLSKLIKRKDYIFIAIKEKGQAMPVAAKKEKLHGFPQIITINQNNIINNDFDANQSEELIAQAIISHSGSMPIKKDDLKGFVKIQKINQDYNLLIDKVSK